MDETVMAAAIPTELHDIADARESDILIASRITMCPETGEGLTLI